MALPNPKGHRVPLEEAVAQARRARGTPNRGGLFLRKEIDELLAQPGCAGLRFYYGQTAEGRETLILVGTDGDGNDMTGGVVLENHFDCPPFCDTASPLNT